MPARETALALMEEWTPSDSLRKHMLAVEGAMRAYAERFGEDAERWGLAGLMHDFDYERFPNDAHAADAEHPSEGVRVLRSLGYPEDVLQAILGHADYTGVARETTMARTLFAVDELAGLCTACALVRPSRSVNDLEPSSVKKKMKDKAFARGVNRDDVLRGAAELGVDLDAHIATVIRSMRERAEMLGLGGSASP
ncbi:MAG: HD domain-containing protein [Gemmatimonadales bacterium]